MKLTPEIEFALVRHIEGRPRSERIRWNDIVRVALDAHGISISRLWLSRNPAIKAAYAARRTNSHDDGTDSETERKAEVVRLRSKIVELTETLRQYDLKIIRFIYNAQMQDISIEILDRPIQPTTSRQKPKAARS